MTETTNSVRRVLVTGGAAGIGAAIVERCRADGLEAVVIDRTGDGIIADLSDIESTTAALEQALAGGPITSIVNNVGAVFPAAAEDQSLAELAAAWELNLRSAMQCTQALLPSMKEASFGRIVTISSRAALGKELRSAYAATKAGLLGLTRVWALELGQYGITANAVAPGLSRRSFSKRQTRRTVRAPKPSSTACLSSESALPRRWRTLRPTCWMSDPGLLRARHTTCAAASL